MPKVLIVEDNELNLDMLSRRLKRRGYDIISAINGKLGVEVATAELPDLILMDITLPVMDGMQATRLLRAQASTASIPIIALTAHALMDDRTKALEAGCDDFDTKPIDLKRLLEKMTALISGMR